MAFPSSVTKQATPPGKVAIRCVFVGLVSFTFFILVALATAVFQRNRSHVLLANDSQTYVRNIFEDLTNSLIPLKDWSQRPCHDVNSQLTQRAAFATNVRAILLVNKGIAYCSSATGSMGIYASHFSPDTDLNNDIDIRLIPDTPMVPGKPAIVLWIKSASDGSGIFTTLNIDITPWLLLASRPQEITGMAIVAGNEALTSWQQKVIPARLLPDSALKTVALPGYPVTLRLYGSILADQDLLLLLLCAVVFSMLTTGCYFLLITRRVHPGRDILLGMKRGEFHVVYQPIIDTRTGNVFALEALLRWSHRTEGSIPPDTFISYAESQQLIAPLTRHLLRLIARDAPQLATLLPAGTRLTVNMSPLHLTSNNFCEDITHWLETMPANYFPYVFEITERSMVNDNNAVSRFNWIHEHGIDLAIDDFGTGHSALIYLEKFNFDYIKIDGGFVQSIGMETVTSPVLDAVIHLAKKIKLHTIAEAVETEQQANWLIEKGVDYMQGYLFSHPCNIEALGLYLHTRSQNNKE
ncbi:MAG: putative cyclic di-GMP phosphodiesterase PdeN [Candidatus Erwinia impunctatus]|nr:putative cyclic di-GMP phosphodiesterase PdeN [Culicoides impunctatus]